MCVKHTYICCNSTLAQNLYATCDAHALRFLEARPQLALLLQTELEYYC